MLVPLDIENKKFQKKMMNGYNVEEVDEFLDEVTADYGELFRENKELKSKIEELEKSLVHYKAIESTLQSTLVMAQTTAEDVKNLAKQQATQIIKDAQGSAKDAVEELNIEILNKKKELENVTQQLDVYKAKMEALLISQLELIKEINKN